jgi:hypothetical protein
LLGLASVANCFPSQLASGGVGVLRESFHAGQCFNLGSEGCFQGAVGLADVPSPSGLARDEEFVSTIDAVVVSPARAEGSPQIATGLSRRRQGQSELGTEAKTEEQAGQRESER